MPAFKETDYKKILMDAEEASAANTEELPEGVLLEIAERAGFKITQEEIDQEAALLMRGYLAQMRYHSFSKGNYADQFLDAYLHKDELTERFQKQAICELLEEEILREVIFNEQLTVAKEELEAEGQAIAVRQNTTMDEVRRFMGEDLSMLESDLLKRKARALIRSAAVVR